MTADANDVFEAFNAYAEWCKGQAHDDGHQQEILARCTCACRGVHRAGSSCTLRRASTGSGILDANAFNYAAPVAAATVGFGSLPVEPIVVR